jgi:uncharacterized membrane protein
VGLDALDLLTAVLLASGAGHQVVVSLGAAVPGLTQVQVGLTALSPPQIAFGPVGTTVTSAQVQLTLGVGVTVAGLAAVTVPVVVSTGQGRATLSAIACGGSTTPSAIDVDVTTAAATLGIGTLDSTGTVQPAPLVSVAGVSIEAQAQATVASAGGSLAFAPPYDWAHAQELAYPVAPAGQALGAGLHLTTVPATALNPVVTAAIALVGTTLTTVVEPALDALVPDLLVPLGIRLGVADVAALGGACPGPELVR